MKSLLTITAILEGVTGLGLAAMPSSLVPVLLGTSLTDPGAIIIARLAGGALMTIAIACWLSRGNTQAAAIIKAMIIYNAFSTILLIYAGLVEKMTGVGLWPAVLVHVGLLVWSISSLMKRNSTIK